MRRMLSLVLIFFLGLTFMDMLGVSNLFQGQQLTVTEVKADDGDADEDEYEDEDDGGDEDAPEEVYVEEADE